MRRKVLRATTVVVLAMAGLLSSWCAASAAPLAMNFDGAKWIWFSPGAEMPLDGIPGGVIYFRKTLTLPEDAKVEAAEVIATCDNLFAMYLNGKGVGESGLGSNAWGSPKRWDISAMLKPGENVVAIEGINTVPGPASLIVKIVVRLTDGSQIELVSDPTWMCTEKDRPRWQEMDFDHTHWNNPRVMGEYGAAPWGRVTAPATAEKGGQSVGAVHKAAQAAIRQAASQGRSTYLVEAEPEADYPWPEAIAFVGDDCSLYRPVGAAQNKYDSLSVTIFNPRNSRAFPEHDLPAPMKVGRKLYVLKPAKPGVEPRVLLDAGTGALGSPSVTYDGKSILLSMAYDGEPFYHIYRVPAEGGKPEKLTDGPFHDIDPVELPDGRIAFTSTRIGTFEEYHNPPSRSLFVMNAEGRAIEPLTNTIIFDNEPEVLADGRIVFIRSDNFFDRGKVETLLHAIHPDGTTGYTEFGLDIGPDYGGRLRANNVGSPAPMADGRLAFTSGPGITVGRLGSKRKGHSNFRIAAGDVAAMPDGRLLCTTASRMSVEVIVGTEKRTIQDTRYKKIAVFDPDSPVPALTVLFDSPAAPLHSPVYLGATRRPPILADKVNRRIEGTTGATGFLYCQNARFTQKTTAGWSHVRAIRVLAGTGLTVRSSHSYIVHAGNETIELGTVPLAPDGSFAVEVPADTPIALQAVDAEGRSELNEMSWIYVRPGEARGCVGCHHTRQATPICQTPMPVAMRVPPLKLLGQGRPHRFRGNNPAVTGLMEMQFDRYREVAGINRHSETSDPLGTSVDEVAELIAQLSGDNTGLKISAAQRLSIYRDPTAAGPLAKSLGDDNREVRVASAFALAACGTRESVQPLLEALTDQDPLVAQAASVAIENLTGHAEKFNAYVTAKKREQQARAWRQWFEGTTWEAIEQSLAERIKSDDRDVVRRAAVALGHTGSAASREVLRQYVTEQREINPLPAWRKAGHVGDAARFNSLAAVNPRTLQAATRTLGYLGDTESVAMLAETIDNNRDSNTANLFLTEVAVEALGRIGTPEAETALIKAFPTLEDYPRYTYWYGDHEALMACHASPVHYFIIEALDKLASTKAAEIVPHLIMSVPVDPDRALLLGNDDYETLVGRVIRRQGVEEAVVETCLAILGDPNGKETKEIADALAKVHRCWGGHPDQENRAAQILSFVCRDKKYESRIREALDRYRALPTEIPRVFDTGIPVVLKLPTKHWVCFFLARTLGEMRDPRSAASLIAILEQEAPEAANGRPDPLGPGVLFLHNDLTPCWRAAVAWALGRIGDRRAVPVLLEVAASAENAPDTRHSAAVALGQIADPASLRAIERLAAGHPEISTRRALLRAVDSCRANRREVGMSRP